MRQSAELNRKRLVLCATNYKTTFRIEVTIVLMAVNQANQSDLDRSSECLVVSRAKRRLLNPIEAAQATLISSTADKENPCQFKGRYLAAQHYQSAPQLVQ